jgi:hypothetical protein
VTIPEAEELYDAADDLQRRGYELLDQAGKARREGDDLIRATRPTFPTDGHREGIKTAVANILAGVEADSHHGQNCGPDDDPRAVGWDDKMRRVIVYHGAPLGRATGGGKLWHFTDEEQAELLDLIRAEGVPIVSEWSHDNGICAIIGRRS